MSLAGELFLSFVSPCPRSGELQFSPLTLCSASLFTWVCHTTVAWLRRACARYSRNAVPSSRAAEHDCTSCNSLSSARSKTVVKNVREGSLSCVKTCRWHRDSEGERVGMEWEGCYLVGADLQYHGTASRGAQEGDGMLWYTVVYIDLLTRFKKHSLLWGIT